MDIELVCKQLYFEKTLTIDEFIARTHESVTSSPHNMIPVLQSFVEVVRKGILQEFDTNTVRNLVEFVIDQSYEHTEYPMFEILQQLVEQQSFPRGSALRTASYIFECNDLQEHRETTIRLAAIRIMKLLMIKGDRAFRSQGARLVNGFIKATTGERNPEVLLENFELARLMVTLLDIQKNEQLMDELFNATCVYFPIRFTGTNESDKILGKQLDVSLRQVLTCSPSFGSLLGVFLIEKLQDDEDEYKDKVDLCILLEDIIRIYPMKTIAPFIQGIFDGLRTTAMDPRHKGGIEEAAHAISIILRPLVGENKMVYDRIAKHNFDNIEPFLVRPEMGLLEKAIEFIRPWTELPEEFEISDFLRFKLLEILFNNIQSASLIDYAQESLEQLGKWLDLVGPKSSKLMTGLQTNKAGAFERIENNFTSLNKSHMHLLAKIDQLNKGLTSNQVLSYLKSAFEETAEQTTRNSAVFLAQSLAGSELLTEVINALVGEYPSNLLVNQLASYGIKDRRTFNTYKNVVFNNGSLDNMPQIVNLFLTKIRSAKTGLSKTEEDILKEVVAWLKENFKLENGSQLTASEKCKVFDLAELVFKLTVEIDTSMVLNTISNEDISSYPYFSLLAIKASTAKRLTTSISDWYDSLKEYPGKIVMSLEYASYVQGEQSTFGLPLSPMALKKLALDTSPPSKEEIIQHFEHLSEKEYPFEELFDFDSVWFNHSQLGLNIPPTPGIDHKEKFLFTVFYPLLQLLEQQPSKMQEFSGMFQAALKLLESVQFYQYDKEIYYEMILNLVMRSLGQVGAMSSDVAELMCLLPQLMKHAPRNANSTAMMGNVMNVIKNQHRDISVTTAALSTLVGLAENSSSITDPDIRRELFAIADRYTIGSSRKVRQMAAALKSKVAKAA